MDQQLLSVADSARVLGIGKTRIISHDLDILTDGDPQLMRSIAERKATIGGKEVTPFNVTGGGKVKLDSRFAKYLNDQVASGNSPLKMIGQVSINTGKDVGGRWDRATSILFDHLITQPSNKLAYSPMFREAYYRRLGELAPGMSPADRDFAAQAAKDNGFGDTAKIIDKVTGKGGQLARADADQIAKIHALNTVKGSLHDLQRRGQFFDIWRNIAPFGEAWKQILSRWATITYQHPETLRKFQVAVDGARGSGFFYTDANGQEVFNYPGSEWASKELFGVPVPLTGSVAGLNIAGNGLPGVGPVVQVPTSYLLPDKPQFDWVRRVLFPFGDSDKEPNPLNTLSNVYAPLVSLRKIPSSARAVVGYKCVTYR